jgi:hypothetical protein
MLSVNPSVLVSLPRPLTTETVFLIRMSCTLVTLGVIHFSILCALPFIILCISSSTSVSSFVQILLSTAGY